MIFTKSNKSLHSLSFLSIIIGIFYPPGEPMQQSRFVNNPGWQGIFLKKLIVSLA
jgi:hypothetical protein